MTSRTHRPVGLLLAGVVVATALAAPASAEQVKLRDARGDLWAAADATTATPAPTVREGDLTRAVVDVTRRAVEVRLHFAELHKQGAYAQYAVTVQSRRGKVVREVLVETSRRDRPGTHRVFNAKGSEVTCDVRHRVAYARDRVSVTLDSRCLGSPKAVRVNVNTAWATRTGVFYSDNVHDTAAQSDAWSGWVRRG